MCFRAVIHERFLKPRVLKRVLCRDALLRVVYKYPLQQVEEFSVEFGVRRYGFLRRSAYVFVYG